MSDHLPRTNRWLIALSVILCLILGGIFTRSSAVTSQADAISDAGAFVSEDQDSAEFTSEETLTDSNDNLRILLPGNCLDALLQIHLKLLRAVLH